MQRIVAVAIVLCCAICAHAQDEQDSLYLTQPSGGEVFYTNRVTNVTIAWAGVNDTARIKLEWSIDGNTWNVIADSLQNLQYSWDITGLPVSTNYRIRATLERPPSGADNVVYSGHGFAVNAGAWSPTDDRIVSTSLDADIWDPTVGGSTPLARLSTSNTDRQSIAWSADSTRIVSAADNGNVAVYSAVDNSEEVVLQHPDGVFKIELAANSTTLVTACLDNRARVFQLPNPTAVLTVTPASTVTDVAMSAPAVKILVTSDDARVYSVAGGLPVTFREHTSGVIAGGWHPSSAFVGTIGGDATLRLWDPTNANEIWNAADTGREGMRSIAFAPNGQFVATGMSDSSAIVWDVTTGAEVARVRGHAGAVRALAWSPQSDMLATGSDDNAVKVYDFAQEKVTFSFAHIGDISSVNWDAKGERLLSTSEDGTARVWRVRNVIVQRDTSNTFTIANPPAAFVRVVSEGASVEIGDLVTIPVRTEGSLGLDLADIDSVQLTLRYNSTVLHLQSTTFNIVSESNVGSAVVVQTSFLPLPLQDEVLGNFIFRATLGNDTLTSLEITNATFVGPGPELRHETRSEPIVITGHCDANGSTRLYQPVGAALAVRYTGEQRNTLEVVLAENSPATLQLFDITGALLYTTQATSSEIENRQFERPMPAHISGAHCIAIVKTPTQVVGLMVGGR